MAPTFKYNAVVTNIHDGDTITVVVDCGFRISYTTPLRFFGINAPELNTADGKIARDYLGTLIKVGDTVIIETFKDPQDKYGRWLANIYTAAGVCLNQAMLDSHHAKPYNGQGPK